MKMTFEVKLRLMYKTIVIIHSAPSWKLWPKKDFLVIYIWSISFKIRHQQIRFFAHYINVFNQNIQTLTFINFMIIFLKTEISFLLFQLHNSLQYTGC